MKKRLTSLLLAGVLSVSLLSGCGSINKNAVAARMDGVEVSLGIANFYCRFQQASAEDYYKAYFGDDVWTQDLYGDGSTLQESLKESVMDDLHDMYTLQAHMDEYGVSLTDEEETAISDAAAAFMSANSSEAVSELGATTELVEEFLTLYTIQNKMEEAIREAADTNVSDEEANMRGYTQIEIATDSYTDETGDSVDYTEDEVAALKQTAEDMVAELAEEGATLESVAGAYGYETTTETYATYEAPEDEDSGEETGDGDSEEETEDEDSEDEDSEEETEDEDPVMTALKGLKEGETSGVIETDDALYIVRVDSDTDAEATEENRDSIIEQRKSDFYTDTLAGWQEDDGWEVEEKQLKKIQFVNSLTMTDPNAETEAGTEDVSDTEVSEDGQ